MPLPVPQVDSRTYRELLNEALARIPAHNPEWTNLSDSDPGVTLLQLFAFMTESLIYRVNRIPQRNRLKFLQLLGIPLQPAQAARSFVAFRSKPVGDVQVETIEPDLEVLAGQVPFRTTTGLQLLPLDWRLYVKKPIPAWREVEVDRIYRRLFASYEIEGKQLKYYETTAFDLPASGVTLPTLDLADPQSTADGCLWLALLARPGDPVSIVRSRIAGQTLTVGVMPALDGRECTLKTENERGAGGPRLTFEMPVRSAEGVRYQPLDARTSVNLLLRPGLVELKLPDVAGISYDEEVAPLESGTGDLPPSLAESDDLTRLVAWIRMRVTGAELTEGLGNQRFESKFSWVGINAAQVIQRTRVTAERLPQGTGQPDQVVSLVNTPVLAESVRLTVNGELWQRVPDLDAAGPEVPVQGPRLASESRAAANPMSRASAAGQEASKVYTVDRESGKITFGDGIHGHRPPAGATIQASYDYGGGLEGMVGIGTIKKSPSLPSHIEVNNPVPSWGGDEGETVEQAERRVPAVLRHRNRLVSVEDFKDIAWRTPGVDLARLDVLPLFHPDFPLVASEGMVTIMVIPKNDHQQPEAPRPDRLFLESVCEYLEPRRLITTELNIRGPEYVPVWVSVGMQPVPGHDSAQVRSQAEQAIRQFLSPINGGFQGTGWPLSKAIESAEIAAAVTRVDGIAKVNQVFLGDMTGSVYSIVELQGLQLPHVQRVSVTEGDAATIDQLRQSAPIDTPTYFPVPVIPDEC